jgi:CheY-like chemotaxis protein
MAPFDKTEVQDREKGHQFMIGILLVEDSKFLRLATERALARAGYEMTSAADGEEALRMARETR